MSSGMDAALFIVNMNDNGSENSEYTPSFSGSPTTFTGTFTPNGNSVKIELTLKGSNTVGDYVEFGCVKVFKSGGFEDHGTNNNGNEQVGISNLLAIKGNITSGVSSSWTGDPTDLTVDSGSDFDDYLSVVGILNVSSWGDVSNEYRLNMRHIAKWANP